MDVSVYIASGILESYVTGAVSDQERREVECMSAIYPEIQQELSELSLALEQYAEQYSVEPPESVKEKLLAQLDFGLPAQHEPVVRPMPVDRTEGGGSLSFRTTWVVAASIGLLMLIFSVFLLSKLRNSQQLIGSLRDANQLLQTDAAQLRDQQSQFEKTLALLREPGMRSIGVAGNEKAPNGKLTVFWNARTRQVAVDVQSLPVLPPDQQYQLWSLVDGKPVDAGVFDSNATNPAVQSLNRSVGRADAFAVTVEKRGGSPTPTLSTLLALGQVGS